MADSPPPEWDLLLSACQKNNVERVKELIEIEGVSPSHANRVGQSALHIASLWGHVDCVQTLLDAGANVHAANQITGATPLHCAIQSSKAATPQLRHRVVQLLVQSDPNLASVGDLYGSIPYDYCQDDETADDTLRQLVQPTLPAIFGALQERNAEELQRILSEDPSAIQTRHLSLTPLLFVVQQLCETNDNGSDNTAAAAAVQLKLLTLLLQHGASCNDEKTTDRQGHLEAPPSSAADPVSTPLHQVCLALQDTYRLDDDQELRTIFMTAARQLATKDNTSKVTVAQALLHDAARRGRLELVEFLVSMANDDDTAAVVNAPGRQGMTPLHFAARSGKVEMVRHLLAQPGIDVTIQDDRGKTALDAAKANDKQEIIELLTNVTTTT